MVPYILLGNIFAGQFKTNWEPETQRFQKSTHMLLGTASTQKLWGTGAVPQIVSVPQIVGDHTWGDKIPVPADTQKTHGLKGPHGSADCDRWYKIKMVTMQFGYL